MPPKERAVYGVLLSIFLFAAGYVGAQRLRQPPKIVIDIPGGPKPAAYFPTPTSSSTPIAESSVAGEVVVHVVGAVNSPGLKHLHIGARIDDAIRAAGGASLTANLEAINLAAKLEDGQQIYVPKKGEQSVSSDSSPTKTDTVARKGGKHPEHPVNLNSASYAQMEELPGVGPSMAEKMMAYRLQHGHLTFEELRAIPGLGPKKLEKIKPWVKG